MNHFSILFVIILMIMTFTNIVLHVQAQSPEPSTEPSVEPSQEPSTLPSLSPSTTMPSFAPSVSLEPTCSPTSAPTTVAPTLAPSTVAPSMEPSTIAPSVAPTVSLEPSFTPTASPTPEPTVTPSFSPTVSIEPSFVPTDSPTTLVPTTMAPSTMAPSTMAPSTMVASSFAPSTMTPTTTLPVTTSSEPSISTIAPSLEPSTTVPSIESSSNPISVATSMEPTTAPTVAPTAVAVTSAPSSEPSTIAPSPEPSEAPIATVVPSTEPSFGPTATPSLLPSSSPSTMEPSSADPSSAPSSAPIVVTPPTNGPTYVPTPPPSLKPSSSPVTLRPTVPTTEPSFSPTPEVPSLTPTKISKAPVRKPVQAPVKSSKPTLNPTITPTTLTSVCIQPVSTPPKGYTSSQFTISQVLPGVSSTALSTASANKALSQTIQCLLYGGSNYQVQVSTSVGSATHVSSMREEVVVAGNVTVKATVTIYYPTSATPMLKALYGNLTQEFKQSVSDGMFATVLHTFAASNNCSTLVSYAPKSLPVPSATQLTSGSASSAPASAKPAGANSASSSADNTMVPGISDFDLEIGIAVFGAALLIIFLSFCLWRRSIYIAQRKQLDRWIMGEVPGLNVINRYSSERAMKKTLDSEDAFAFEVNNRGRLQAQTSGRGPQYGSGKFGAQSVGSYYDYPRDASGRQLHNASFRSYDSNYMPNSYKTQPNPVEEEEEEEEDDEEEDEEEEEESPDLADLDSDKKEEAKPEGESKTESAPVVATEKPAEAPVKDDASEAKKSVKSIDGSSSNKSNKKKNKSGKSTQPPSDQAQFDEFVGGSRREDSSGRVYFQDPRYNAQYAGSQRQFAPPGYEDPRFGGSQPAMSLRQVLPQGYYDDRGQSYGSGYDAYGYPREPYYPPSRPPADFGYGGGYGSSAGYGDDRFYMNRVPADYTSPRDPYSLQQPGYQPNYPVSYSPASGGSRGGANASGKESDRRPPQSPLFQPRQL